jgi:hypothetical protein
MSTFWKTTREEKRQKNGENLGRHVSNNWQQFFFNLIICQNIYVDKNIFAKEAPKKGKKKKLVYIYSQIFNELIFF